MTDRSVDQLYLGAISGTSVDGLDLALLAIDDTIRFLAAETVAFPAALRQQLLQLGQPENDNLDLLGEADQALGTFIADAALNFLAKTQTTPGAIRAFGSHGQTVRHRPDGEHPFTWQIGDPNLIAELTGITTVADFRRRDMAAGGQGAPLVPRFHEALLQADGEPRAVLNIGGISNLTLLPPKLGDAITGFDCGPGNALLDSWCGRHLGTEFDADGTWAAAGQVDRTLLRALSEDEFLQRLPPKSTGREHYNLNWLDAQLGPNSTDAVDVQRTLLEFTAVSIADALERWGNTAQRLIVCGGGRRNPVLLARLQALCPMPVETSEEHGYDGDAIEAAAFAWLARQRLLQANGSAASVTGASGDRILGAVFPGGSAGG